MNNAIRYFVGWLSKGQRSASSSGQQGGGGNALLDQSSTFSSGVAVSGGSAQTQTTVEEELKAKYESVKRSRTLIDFGDMIPLALTLLRRDSGMPKEP